MKYLIITIYCLLPFDILYSQDMRNNEFTFTSGDIFFKLSNEGAYCRIVRNYRKSVYFWPNDELNQNNKKELITFVFNYFDSLEKNNLSYKVFPGLGMSSAEITLFNRDVCKLSKVVYTSCYDKHINEIIELIDNLIPKKKRRKIGIYNRKIVKDPFINDCEFIRIVDY